MLAKKLLSALYSNLRGTSSVSCTNFRDPVRITLCIKCSISHNSTSHHITAQQKIIRKEESTNNRFKEIVEQKKLSTKNQTVKCFNWKTGKADIGTEGCWDYRVVQTTWYAPHNPWLLIIFWSYTSFEDDFLISVWLLVWCGAEPLYLRVGEVAEHR